MSASGQITELLLRLSKGDRAAEEDLIPQVYDELHKLAASYLRRERPGHTLQATALVNEAYLRLVGPRHADWAGRAHFFGVAAQIMRRILTDHARRKLAHKRGGDSILVEFDEKLRIDPQRCELLSNLDDALQRLAELDARAAKVVELRFFGGLKEEEIAEVIGQSSRTVKRIWVVARAWLYDELSDLPSDPFQS